DRFTMKDGHSEGEWDHHAFLHDPATGLTVFPYERWDDRKGGPPPTGALVLTVTDDGISEEGAVSHDESRGDWWAPIRRAMLIDGRLVTVSDAGIMLTDADTLDELDWVQF
ncbi:MAG: beta-propeller domain-containing protein, partial [Actinomycetota bacterium]